MVPMVARHVCRFVGSAKQAYPTFIFVNGHTHAPNKHLVGSQPNLNVSNTNLSNVIISCDDGTDLINITKPTPSSSTATL